MTPLLLVLAALAIGSSPEQAPATPTASQLGVVAVTGARRYSEADVTKLSALKPGQPVSPAELEALVKQMAGTGLFASLQYRYATAGNASMSPSRSKSRRGRCRCCWTTSSG